MTRQRQGALLALLLCVALPVLGKKDRMRPLRFPFGLTPAMAPGEVQIQLAERGLKFMNTKDEAGDRIFSWRMSGQIVSEEFNPGMAIATFRGDTLFSFVLAQTALPDCGAAQPAFLAALNFVRMNYDPKESPVTIEPALDTLDCGPHFQSDHYTLRRENKTTVCTVVPEKTAQGFDVRVTYYDRPHLNNPSKETDEKKPGVPATTQQNL